MCRKCIGVSPLSSEKKPRREVCSSEKGKTSVCGKLFFRERGGRKTAQAFMRAKEGVFFQKKEKKKGFQKKGGSFPPEGNILSRRQLIPTLTKKTPSPAKAERGFLSFVTVLPIRQKTGARWTAASEGKGGKPLTK